LLLSAFERMTDCPRVNGAKAGKFVIKKSAGQHHFVLKAAKGETIATSARYATRPLRRTGLNQSRRTPPTEPTVDKTGE